jgi:hypothetical protein
MKKTPSKKAKSPKGGSNTRKPAASAPRVRAVTLGNGRLDWSTRYLRVLSETGQKMEACRLARITMTSVWERRQKDQAFAAAEVNAMRIAQDAAESEAYRRAIKGVQETHYGRDGKISSRRVVYSDTLLLRVLERGDASWRTKTAVDVTTGGKPIFATRADRKAAIALARQEAERPLA